MWVQPYTSYSSSEYTAKMFREDIDSKWEKVKRLYMKLHDYVRFKLRGVYGENRFASDGLIHAHLLGEARYRQYCKL